MVKNLPLFLAQNDYIKEKIVRHARSNLDQLSAELILEFVHDKILPNMIDEQKDEEEMKKCVSYEEKKKMILKQYQLTCICPRTIYCWMHLLGFKYQVRKKGYYVDGHERPATVAYWYEFVTRYLK